MTKTIEKKEGASFWSYVVNMISNIRLSWFLGVILVGIFVLLLFFIHTSVIEDARFIYGKNALTMKNDVPRWVDENGLTNKIKLNTKDVSKTYLGKSYFAEDTLINLHTALLNTHWVKKAKLEKSYPANIQMTVEFRKPIVAFLNGDYWYTLDDEYQLVPIVERKGQEQLNIVRLIDTQKIMQPLKPGEKILLDSIQRAIDLSLLITDRFTTSGKLLKIEFIKSQDEKQTNFRLIFQNGLDVMWGNFLREDEIERFPGKFLSSEEKLGLLVTKLNKNPTQLHLNVEFVR